jgi:hypothetical protein
VATSSRGYRDPSELFDEPTVRSSPPRTSFALLLEKWGPYLLAACAFAGVWYFPNLWLLKAEWKSDLLTNVIAASTILAAYLLTAATILPALEEKAVVQKLRAAKYYDFIVGYIARAAKAAGSLLVLSVIAIPLTKVVSETSRLKAHADLLNQVFSAVWWALAILSVSFVYVATRILFRLLRAPR